MKKLQPIIIFVLFVAFVVMYLRTPSGHKQEIERLERQVKRINTSLDSCKIVIRESRYREIALRLRYEASERARLEAGKDTDKWRKRYEYEKNKPIVRYNDVQLDSILTAWYGR